MMLIKILPVRSFVLITAFICAMKTTSCLGQEHGSAEARRRYSDYMRDIEAGRQRGEEIGKQAENEAKQAAQTKAKLSETGSNLFGTYPRLKDIITTKSQGSLRDKKPSDFRVGDWGLLGEGLKAVNRVSDKEYLVTCLGNEDVCLLLRGFDISKMTDGVEFILNQPVAIKKTFTYSTVSGADKTVLVVESNDEEIQKLLAKEAERQREVALNVEREANREAIEAERAEKRKANEEALLCKERTRTWTDSTSGLTIKAEFLSRISEKVKLKKEDGSLILLPISQLSAVDQDWIHDWPKTKKALAMKSKEQSAPVASASVQSSRPEAVNSKLIIPQHRFEGNYSVTFSGPSSGSLKLELKANGKFVLRGGGVDEGKWRYERDMLTMTYDNKAEGYIELRWDNANTLTGKNVFLDGRVFKWVAVTDVAAGSEPSGKISGAK